MKLQQKKGKYLNYYGIRAEAQVATSQHLNVPGDHSYGQQEGQAQKTKKLGQSIPVPLNVHEELHCSGKSWSGYCR